MSSLPRRPKIIDGRYPAPMAKRRQPAKKKRASGEAAEKAVAKKARRAERQRLEAEARAQAVRKAKLRRGALTAAGVALLALAGFFVFSRFQPGSEVAGVEKPVSLGSSHLSSLGETFNYASATPTSGTHAPRAPGCGVLFGGLSLEFAVHALEHGVVVVWYRPDLEADVLPELTSMIQQWDSHVIVASNPRIPEPLVATAWNRLKRFDAVGPDVAEFIDVYRRRGPENVPCDIR